MIMRNSKIGKNRCQKGQIIMEKDEKISNDNYFCQQTAEKGQKGVRGGIKIVTQGLLCFSYKSW
jgi:hypothetical protein